MRILLTGGSGQVGTELRRRGSMLDLLAPTHTEFNLAAPEHMGDWLRSHRPDLILSVGAYTAVDRAEDEPELAHRINAEAVVHLAQYCAKSGAPLVHLSTDYVFAGDQDRPYRPSDPASPTGVYGASKLAGERAAAQTPKHLILRTSWVFAAHGSNFVRTMLRLASDRDQLRVVSDQFGGPTWAGHIAEALLALVARLARGETLAWGTYHLGGQPHLSWHAFADTLLRQALSKGLIARLPVIDAIRTDEYPTRARRPANSRLDGSLTYDRLGLVPPDWQQGLAAVLDELAEARR